MHPIATLVMSIELYICVFVHTYFYILTSRITQLRPGLNDTEQFKLMLLVVNSNVQHKIKPPTAMRIKLGSQKLPPNIIPVEYESQLCTLTIDQSILIINHAA